MSNQHLSMRGEVVDFNRLRDANATEVALGNASMNARGDIIDNSGVVLKTQEQIEKEWQLKIAEQKDLTHLASIKDSFSNEITTTPDFSNNEIVSRVTDVEKEKNIKFQDANFEPEMTSNSEISIQAEPQSVQSTKPRRKIVESD